MKCPRKVAAFSIAFSLIAIDSSAKNKISLDSPYYNKFQLNNYFGCVDILGGEAKQRDYCWCYSSDMTNNLKNVVLNNHLKFEDQMVLYWSKVIPDNKHIETCKWFAGL